MKRRSITSLLMTIIVGWTLLPGNAASQTTAQVQLLGTRLLRDADFNGNADWTNGGAPPRQDIGGRVQVYIRNTATTPLQINDIAINGKPFAQLTTQAISTPAIADTKWWRAWPNLVLPGKVAAITVRLVNLAADLPANATFELRTSQGNVSFGAPQFRPNPSNLWMPALNFADDLSTVTLFVGNRGSTPITLKNSGGLRINGGAESGSATVPQTTLAPGEVVPISVSGTAAALTRGEQAVFQVVAQSGEQSFGSLRVFPYRFMVQSQMQGNGYDAADRARHFAGDWDDSQLLYDEPLGGGYTPMEVVKGVNDWLRADAQNQQTQVEIHNTGYGEGQIYDDIADIANSHHGTTRQDLATYETWPKPNWYMPQDSWGRNEGFYQQENWYPPEDLQFQAFQAVGRGAKSIQWFLFQNHWEQGWGRQSGTDFARIYQDLYRSGHIGNPLIWNQVGRVSGVLHVVEPYLTNSAHMAGTQTDGLQADTVVSVNSAVGGIYKAVVTVMDARTPHGERAYQYGTPAFEQQTRYNQIVQVTLPAFVYNAVDHAYGVDPLLGVQEFTVRKRGNNAVVITLPEVRVGTLLVLGNAADRAFLQGRWAEAQANFASYGDGRAQLLASAANHAPGPWRAPEHSRRKRITVTNNGTTNAATLALPLDLPLDRAFDPRSFQVLEAHGDDATAVPFFVQGQQTYESFAASDTAARLAITTPCIAAALPNPCSLSFQVQQNAVTLNSAVAPQLYQWRVSIANPQPWRATFPDDAIPADRFSQLSVEAQLSTTPFWNQIYINVSVDADGDGTYEKGRAFPLRDEADLWQDLGDGWIRSTFDMQRVFHAFYPDEQPRGRYAISLVTQVPPNSALSGTFPWSIRNITVAGGSTAIVQPATPLAPGESRAFEIYYDVQENGGAAAPLFTHGLATAAGAPDIGVVSTADERAGVAVQVSGPQATITTQAHAATTLLRHFSADGTLISTQVLDTASGSTTASLARAAQPGDTFVAIPLQKDGEGTSFVFGGSGAPLSGNVPQATVIPAAWRMPLRDIATDGNDLVPFSLDASADGMYIALGAARIKTDRSDTSGVVQVRKATGALVWEKTFDGRVFYVRFAPDGQSLYVAANLGVDSFSGDLYTNAHILKYTLAGAEQWRHKVGSGTPIPAAQQGRTVFDMQVYPNGDLLYTEWNTFGVHLDGKTGKVVWATDTGFGQARYTPRVVPLQDGGAILLSSVSKCVDGSGTTVASVVLGGEAEFAAASPDTCARWALAGSTVRLITGSGSMQISSPDKADYAGDGSYVGRTPRALAFSVDGAYLATGTADGIFSLLDHNGAIRWQKRDSSSYVTQVAFLPNHAGVVFAREIFDYQQSNVAEGTPNGWRFRDTVEAYDLSGRPLWRHEGGWRASQPFMTQFVLSQDGKQLAVLSGEDVRSVDLRAAAVSNSYLYPVDAIDQGAAIRDQHLYLPLVDRHP